MTEPNPDLLESLRLVDELLRRGLILREAAVNIQSAIVIQSIQQESMTKSEHRPGDPVWSSSATSQTLSATTGHQIGFVGGNVSYYLGDQPEKPSDTQPTEDSET